MAYHCEERGHSPIVVGALYSKYGSILYKLKRYNKATGMCKLESVYFSGSIWISEAKLSNWNLFRRE